MVEYKTEKNIIICKKGNMTEPKSDMTITKINKHKKREQQFYDGA